MKYRMTHNIREGEVFEFTSLEEMTGDFSVSALLFCDMEADGDTYYKGAFNTYEILADD